MNKLYVITVLPSGYGEGIMPTASFGRADHWNTESEAEHNEAYEAFMDSLASLPKHLIAPSPLTVANTFIEEWEEGIEVWGIKNATDQQHWRLVSKEEADCVPPDRKRKVLIPQAVPVKDGVYKGLQFTVPNDLSVFKIKKITGDNVTVSWMDKGVERFVDYGIGIVRLNFATKSWNRVYEPLPAKDDTGGGESICQKCGGDNPVWSANNELWNRVMDSREGIVCPTCFVEEANKKGIQMFGIAPQKTSNRDTLSNLEFAEWISHAHGVDILPMDEREGGLNGNKVWKYWKEKLTTDELYEIFKNKKQ